MATMAKPGFFLRVRIACFRSSEKFMMGSSSL
jgi:hypothetical protein